MVRTELHDCAARGDAEQIKFILQFDKRVRRSSIGLMSSSGVDIDATDRVGNTALHLAAEAGSLKAVRLLVQAGAALHLQDSVGYTALDRACRKDNNDRVVAALKAAIERDSQSSLASTSASKLQKIGKESNRTSSSRRKNASPCKLSSLQLVNEEDLRAEDRLLVARSASPTKIKLSDTQGNPVPCSEDAKVPTLQPNGDAIIDFKQWKLQREQAKAKAHKLAQGLKTLEEAEEPDDFDDDDSLVPSKSADNGKQHAILPLPLGRSQSALGVPHLDKKVAQKTAALRPTVFSCREDVESSIINRNAMDQGDSAPSVTRKRTGIAARMATGKLGKEYNSMKHGQVVKTGKPKKQPRRSKSAEPFGNTTKQSHDWHQLPSQTRTAQSIQGMSQNSTLQLMAKPSTVATARGTFLPRELDPNAPVIPFPSLPPAPAVAPGRAQGVSSLLGEDGFAKTAAAELASQEKKAPRRKADVSNHLGLFSKGSKASRANRKQTASPLPSIMDGQFPRDFTFKGNSATRITDINGLKM